MPLASEMRERIALERLDDPTKTWTPLDTVWAAVEPQGEGGYRFRIRYRADLPRTKADLEPAMRVRFDGDYYDLTDAVETARRAEVQLIASRRIVDDIQDLGSGARRIKAWPASP